MLTAIQIKLIVYGLLAAGVAYGLYDIKTTYSERSEFKLAAEKSAKELKDYKENEKHEVKVLEVYHDAEEKIVYVDKIVTKEVIKYRDANPVRCTLPADFVRIYNQSIDPRTAIGADDQVKAP